MTNFLVQWGINPWGEDTLDEVRQATRQFAIAVDEFLTHVQKLATLVHQLVPFINKLLALFG